MSTALTWIIALIFVAAFIAIPIAIINKVEQKDKDRVDQFAPDDAKQIKQVLSELGIPVPEGSYSNTQYLRVCLTALRKYADSKVRSSIDTGYQYKHFDHTNFYILYNKSEVLIPSDILCRFNGGVEIHATESGIKYFGTRGKKDGISISALIADVKKLESKEFIKSNIKTAQWNDLVWYLNGVPTWVHAGNIGVGALGGALLLGPIGAVAGAVSGNKKANEEKEKIEREMELVFGYCNGKQWVINTDWNSSSFQSDFKFFLDTCPDRRARDVERHE